MTSRRTCSVVDGNTCECPPAGFVGDPLPVACYACGDDVCRNCSTLMTYRKRRCRVCVRCQDERKIGRASPLLTQHYMYPAAILKGVIEHNDGTSYFGSLIGFQHHRAAAVGLGWITRGRKPRATAHGQAVYADAGLAALPTKRLSRAYAWNWDKVQFTPAHVQRKGG